MNRSFKKFILAVPLFAVLIACNPTDEGSTSDCTPANGAFIELTTDISGKTYTVGQTVKLEWKIDRNQIKQNTSVQIEVSIDNGISWTAMTSPSVEVPSGDQYQCMSYDWVIGSEGEAVAYESVNQNCLLWIHEYSNSSNGVKYNDRKFTVNK